MHRLSFFVGVLLGWLVGWWIGSLVCRQRAQAPDTGVEVSAGYHYAQQANPIYTRPEVSPMGGESEASAPAPADQDGGLSVESSPSGVESTVVGESAPVAAFVCQEGIAETAVLPTQDDLTVVEGIGPKIAGLLNENAIRTFEQLGSTGVDDLRRILSQGGPRFRLADPSSWPQQARLAQKGDWDSLRALKGSLRAGRESQQTPVS